MSKRQDEMIQELVSLILMQQRELDKMERKVNRIKQYLEVYEEFLARRD
jgi:uncharacterized coiled-coil protein SlyX